MLPRGGSRPADWVPENVSLQNLRTCRARWVCGHPARSSADGAVSHSATLAQSCSRLSAMLAGVALVYRQGLRILILSVRGAVPLPTLRYSRTSGPDLTGLDEVSIPDCRGVGTEIGNRGLAALLLEGIGFQPSFAFHQEAM